MELLLHACVHDVWLHRYFSSGISRAYRLSDISVNSCRLEIFSQVPRYSGIYTIIVTVRLGKLLIYGKWLYTAT